MWLYGQKTSSLTGTPTAAAPVSLLLLLLAAALGAYNAMNANNIPDSHDPGGIAEGNHDMRAMSRMQGTRRDMIASIGQSPQVVADSQ